MMALKDEDEKFENGIQWVWQDPPGTWVVKDVYGPLANRPFGEDSPFEQPAFGDMPAEEHWERNLTEEGES